MVKLFTVHGTFAGDDADKGEKWWQQGSPFLRGLQDLIADRLDVEPFHWSGKNSELDRRRAGAKLSKAVDREDEPAIVMGHSHGGSVGVQALLDNYLRAPTEKLSKVRGFISVCMPMIQFKNNRNPFSWFNIQGRLLLLAVLSLLALVVAGVFQDIRNAAEARGADRWDSDNVVDTSTDLVGISFEAILRSIDTQLVILLIALFILGLYLVRNRRRSRTLSQNTLAQVMRERFVGLSHPGDEALGALGQVKAINPSLIDRGTIFVSVFSALTFALMFGIFVQLMGNSYFGARSYMVGATSPAAAHQEGAYTRTQLVGFDLRDPENGFLPEEWRDVTPVSLKSARGGVDLTLEAPFRATVRLRDDMRAYPVEDIWAHPAMRAVMGSEAASRLRPDWPRDVGYVFLPEGTFTAFAENAARVTAGLQPPEKKTFPNGREISVRPSGQILSTQSPKALVEAWIASHMVDRNLIEAPISALLFWGTAEELEAEIGTDGGALRANTKYYLRSAALPDVRAGCENPVARVGTICQAIYLNDRTPVSYVLEAQRELSSWLDDWLAGFSRSWPFVAGDGFLANLVRGPITTILSMLMIFLPALMVGAFISALITIFLTPALSGFITQTLRRQAYGNDGYGERVVGIAPSLDFVRGQVGNLPKSVAKEMMAASAKDAPMAIERLRALIASGELTSGAEGMDALAVAMKFDKSELLHNAYFHSPLFIRYVAAILVHQFGLKPSAAFDKDDAAQAFLSQLKAGQAG